MNEKIYSKIPQPFQNIGCQELLKEPFSHCGWVRKRHLASKLKLFRWPKVYMIVSRGCVYYFRNEWANSQSGKFSLFGFNTVARATEKIKIKEAMYAFKIEHLHKEEFKSYFFACSSESEMKTWMKVIKAELEIANNSSKRDGDYYYTQGFTPTKAHLEQTPETQGFSNDSGFGHSADGDAASVNFQEIEESIYDDPASFIPPSDYGMYAKKADEASDDEDIPDMPPPLPRREPKESESGGKQGKRKKKRRSKKRESEQETSNQTVASSEAKDAASAIASEMQGLFGKKKQVNRDESFSSRQKRATPTRMETPPPKEEEDDADEDDEENADDYWQAIYFEGEKDKASEVIRDIGENGVFLVRDSEDGGKVLVAFAQNMPKKYKIQFKDNQYFLAQTGPKADTLEDLLYEYFSIDLPNTTVKLTTPFQLHSHYR